VKKYLVGMIVTLIMGWFVTMASAQQFGPTAATPGTIVNGGGAPTLPPVPVPPMTIRGVVQTLHGAPLGSGKYNTQMWLYEMDPFTGVSIIVAGTQCPYDPPPQPQGMPLEPQYPQACADDVTGAFQIIGDWWHEPLSPAKSHMLIVWAESNIVKKVQIPVGVSNVDLRVINLEASPIETATTLNPLVAGNEFVFTVRLKKIVPESMELTLAVIVTVQVPGSVSFYNTFYLPSQNVTVEEATTDVPFSIPIPEEIDKGFPVSAFISIVDSKKPWIGYAQAFTWAMK